MEGVQKWRWETQIEGMEMRKKKGRMKEFK
jgi:hypothetical protein